MINAVLFKKELKSNYKIFLIFLAVLTLYGTMVTAMFDPRLGESLSIMAESMPEIFAAVGMLHGGTTLISFLVNYLYGFLLIVLPLIFILLTASRLVTRYIDRGSLACLLATPNTRGRIIRTQALVSILGIFSLVLYTALLCIAAGHLFFPGDLDIAGFIRVNAGLLGLLLFLGGISFCSACLFNDSRLASGLGAGLPILFILLQMISQVSDKLEALKYATPLTLFDSYGLVDGSPDAVVFAIILYAAGFLLYGAGILVFCRKDLSI